MNTISDRIKLLRKHFRLNQEELGALAGRSKAAVSQWERGINEPDKLSLHTLERTARVNQHWITYGTEPMLISGDRQKIKTLAPASAAVDVCESPSDLQHGGQYVLVSHYDVHPCLGEECEWVARKEDEPLIFRAQWFRSRGLDPENCKALYVRGDSMSPTLMDGDTVLIDTSSTQILDDAIYALLHHDALYIKRLFTLPGRALQLRSDNLRYPTIDVSAPDLAHLIILGRQIWRGG